jgi:hypothetical protein
MFLKFSVLTTKNKNIYYLYIILGKKPNEINVLVAGVGFEPTTFRLCVYSMISMGYGR